MVLALAVVLMTGISPAQSRESGVIQGKITDSEGTELPGVTVVATSPSLMGTRSAVTDQEGRYRFAVLPGGTYTIDASLEGFTPTKRTDIILHAGTTLTIDITLSVKALEEELVVTGEAPMVDVTDASTAKTFLTKDILQNIPNFQNVAQIFLLAPGVVGEYLSETYAYGGSRLSNSYQLDGVELTDSWAGSGTYTAPIDYNVIEEAQIVGLGAPAEYGNFTGAVANIITKSGGNTFSGDIQALYQGSKWKSENIDKGDAKWALLPETPANRLLDPSFHLGGPIIRDKLWFFGGFEYYAAKDELASTGKVRNLTFPKAFLKLTFQLDEKNKFQAFFQYHNRESKNNQLSNLFLPEANQDLLYPVYAGNLSFLHMFSPSTILEIKATGYDMSWDSIPSSGKRDIAGHYDLATGVFSRNLYFWSHWYSSRLGTTASLSTSVDNLIRGSHDFKFGVEFERSPGGGSYDFNGPDKVVYYDFNGEPYLAEKFVYSQDAINTRISFYAQDAWKIAENIVINPGLRFNIFRGSIPPLKSGDKTVYKPTGFEPRLGFVWDILKTHKTLLKAHYGRYFEGTKTYNFAQMTPMSDDTYYTVGPDWSTLTELFTIPGVDLYTMDPDIKHPAADQFVLGLEQELAKNFAASVSFIYKNWFNIIDPVNVGGIFEPMSVSDPDTGEIYTVYNQTNPGGDHYYITNPEAGKDIGAAYPDIVSFTPKRKYRALEIALTKRLADNWQLFVSYVYSKEEGNYSSENIPGMETLFFNPNNQINSYGIFRSSVPHIFKVQGTYFLPWGFSLSAFYTYFTGTPWQRTLLITGLNQGTATIRTEEPGSRRLPDTNNLDFRLEKSFYYRNFRLSMMLDVFNLFNQSREVNIYSNAGVNFGKPTEICIPRSFRAGLRLFF
jgi:hypothetical protein